MKSVYVPFSANFAYRSNRLFLSCFDMAEEKLDLRNISNSSIEQNRDESLADFVTIVSIRFQPHRNSRATKRDVMIASDRKRVDEFVKRRSCIGPGRKFDHLYSRWWFAARVTKSEKWTGVESSVVVGREMVFI